MNLLRSLLLVPVAACAAACSSIDVTSDDLAAGTGREYGTFAISAPLPGDPVLDEIGREVRAAIVHELEGKGLDEVPAVEAELLVFVSAEVVGRVVERDPYFWAFAAERVERGTLTIEVVDTADGLPVWRGSGSSDVGVSGVLATTTRTEVAEVQDWDQDWSVSRKVAAILAEYAPRVR